MCTRARTQNETLPCAWQPDDLQSWTRVFSAWKKPADPRVDLVAAHWADWNAGAHATGIHQRPKRQRTLSSNGDSTKSPKAWTRWKNRDVRRELRRGERWTGPGTILKGLIKPAKCHAATHVPSRRSEKICPRCSETRQLVYRTHQFFRFFNFTTPSGIFARASHCARWRIFWLYSGIIILRLRIYNNVDK